MLKLTPKLTPLYVSMVLLGVLNGPAAYAAVVQAASCSAVDVQNAVNLARDGDVVLVPGGVCSWTQRVLITAGITLQGAGIDHTIIKDDVQSTEALRLDTQEGQMYRVTGFTFQSGTVGKASNVWGTIGVVGDSKTWRIDHVKFDSLEVRAVFVKGFTYGVIDRCEFIHLPGAQASIHVEHDAWNGHSYGDGSWADETYLGTEKFVFIEDNSFYREQGNGSVLDTDGGGRWVFRFNSITNNNISTHGTESGGRKRGVRAYEIYGNTFTHQPNWANMVMVRGGTGVIYDNVADGFNNLVAWRNFRSHNYFQFWPTCDGSSPYDKTDGVVYEVGTHTGSAGATDLTDGSKNWKVNEWRDGGFSVRNVSKGWGSFVLENSSTAIALQPGTHNSQTWDPGDSYEIRHVEACLDQVGRGKGYLMTNHNPPMPLAWPEQVLDPVYLWNNRRNGAIVSGESFNHAHIKQGREVYYGTARPGYTPYAYPHPLVAPESTGTPNPPTNLSVSE